MLIDRKPVSDTWDTASVQNKLLKYIFDSDSANCQEGLASLGVVLNLQSHWDSVSGMVLNPFLSGCYLSVKL